jgi:transmembrane sensor
MLVIAVDDDVDAHARTATHGTAERRYGSDMTANDAPSTSLSTDAAPRRIAREVVLRLASGDVTLEQMAALRSWLAADRAHRAAFELERAVWRGLTPLRDALAHSIDAPPRRVAASRFALPISRRQARWLSAGAALAACLALFVMAGDLLVRLRADYVTDVGEIAQFVLPDHSIAVLNTHSAIAVRYDGAERHVELLRGEAWFKVRKDPEHPFRVYARDGMTEAVGTAFGVRRGEDEVTVAVTEGVVAVTSPDEARSSERQSVKVSAGLLASYMPGRVPGEATAFDLRAAFAWRKHHIEIDDLPLHAAIDELNRYRRGRIVLLDRARAEAHVSGVFAVGQLDQGIEGLAAALGLRVSYLTSYLMILR